MKVGEFVVKRIVAEDEGSQATAALRSALQQRISKTLKSPSHQSHHNCKPGTAWASLLRPSSRYAERSKISRQSYVAAVD